MISTRDLLASGHSAWNREIDLDFYIAPNANRIVYISATARDAFGLCPLMHVRGRLTTARMSESGMC